MKIRLFFLFLINHSVEDLDDLNDGYDKDRKTERNAVFSHGEVSKLKRICEEGNLDNDGGEDEGEDSRAPEPPVLTLHLEDRAV